MTATLPETANKAAHRSTVITLISVTVHLVSEHFRKGRALTRPFPFFVGGAHMIANVRLTIVLLFVGSALLSAQEPWMHKDSLWGEKYTNGMLGVLRNGGLRSIQSDSSGSFQTFLFRYVFNPDHAIGS